MADPIANGADTSDLGAPPLPNGATSALPPIPPVPARATERSPRPFPGSTFDRDRDRERDRSDRDTGTGMDGFRGFGAAAETQTDAKLNATTRMVNAYMGYLKDACGRRLDELTPADVASLGGMFSMLQGLEPNNKRGGH